ncbi:MAG: HAD-IIB family hydrolase [Spirochaetales bacterium]|nr:HAD-IIB family hydrolase [Spirochaetales bacterium]
MYIQLISIHGLVKGKEIEMGRDADTGGQIRYVIDFIRHLSRFKEVSRVDLFTRQIKDKRVSDDYSQKLETINEKCRIVRLPCGGSRYMRKEKLWPFLDEFVDRMIAFTREESRIPDFVHGHYADGGYVAREISVIFGIPLLFTGHSLGKNKLEYLLDNGWTREKADKTFAIERRINAEESILGNADLVITSTTHEKDRLYRDYINKVVPQFAVIPPGLDFERFFPYYEYELPSNSISEVQKQSYHAMVNEMQRFFMNPDKPLILSLCRPDARKNIDLLIKVYGESPELQAIANLAVFAGIRDDINRMEEGERQVLTDILLQMDRYDLYGKMAIPKHHNPMQDVPELYRIAAFKRGVFVNPTYLENFGLTLIEASAAGLPIIASNKGGPKDIISNCDNGKLIDMNDTESLVQAIKDIILNQEEWNRLSRNGIEKVRQYYSWESHCTRYLTYISTLREASKEEINVMTSKEKNIGKRLSKIDYLFITDLDDTLVDEKMNIDIFRKFYHINYSTLGFGVATGRPEESVRSLLKELKLTQVDIIISSVGTEIYYGMEELADKGWANHISKDWKPDKIRSVLDKLDFITLQPEPETQRSFKISYDLIINDQAKEIPHKKALPTIHNQLMNARLAYTLIFSHGVYIDIIPYRASKGKAVRYMSAKWKIPFDRIYTAGNSGNDRDMLTGSINGIVVGNHEEELSDLKGTHNIYFAQERCTRGVMEGLAWYNKRNMAGLKIQDDGE